VKTPWITVGVLVVSAAAAATLRITISSTLTHHDGLLRPPLPTRSAPADDSVAQTAGPMTPPTSPRATEDPTPSPSRSQARPTAPASTPPPSLRVRDVLIKFRYAIRQGYDAGEIRDDVARDLDNVARNALDHTGSADESVLRRDIADLRDKVETRRREGAITRHRAAEFLVILDQSGFSR
jgi:hypothetical protein